MLRSALNAWPIILVAGGIVLLLSLSHALPQVEGAHYLGSDKCKVCHQKLIQPPVYDAWAERIHSQQEAADDAAPEEKYRRTTGFDPETGKSMAQGVGCENCHGPGSNHAKAENLTDREKAKTTIVRPQELDDDGQLSVCGACHSVGQMPTGEKYPKGFVPGMELEDLNWELAEDPGDTRLRQLNDIQQSMHVENGVTCITCHTSHGEKKTDPLLREPIKTLCTQEGCHPPDHQDFKHAQAAGHEVTPDMTCSNCHMPEKHHIFVPPAHEEE